MSKIRILFFLLVALFTGWNTYKLSTHLPRSIGTTYPTPVVFTPGGDLSGDSSAQTVSHIQGFPVSSPPTFDAGAQLGAGLVEVGGQLVLSTAGGGGWVTAYDRDLSTLSNQTLSSGDTTYTIDGNSTWRLQNSAATTANPQVVNGTGIQIKPSAVTSVASATMTAPILGPALTSLIPNYSTLMELRVCAQYSANFTGASDALNVGTWVYDTQQLYAMAHSAKIGFLTSNNGVGALAITHFGTVEFDDLMGSSDDVVCAWLPEGSFGAHTIAASGTYSSGWPSWSNMKMRAIARASTGGVLAQSGTNTLKTGADVYLLLAY